MDLLDPENSEARNFLISLGSYSLCYLSISISYPSIHSIHHSNISILFYILVIISILRLHCVSGSAHKPANKPLIQTGNGLIGSGTLGSERFPGTVTGDCMYKVRDAAIWEVDKWVRVLNYCVLPISLSLSHTHTHTHTHTLFLSHFLSFILSFYQSLSRSFSLSISLSLSHFLIFFLSFFFPLSLSLFLSHFVTLSFFLLLSIPFFLSLLLFLTPSQKEFQ